MDNNNLTTHALTIQIMDTYDQIAEDFDPTRTRPWPESIEFIKTLDKGSTVLDLGCGNGRNSQHLAEQGFRVISLDLSINMLKIAAEKIIETGPHPKFLQADIIQLPLKPATIDAALLIAALHHITTEQQRISALEELYRCLKPGGKALVSVWAFEQPKFQNVLEEQNSGIIAQAIRQKAENEPQSVLNGQFGDVYVPWTRKDGPVFRRYYHLFYGDELRVLLEKTEFEILDVYRVKDNYYAKVGKI